MFKIVGAGVVMLMLSSCVVHEHHVRRMPPGHAKKVYGGSARYYALARLKKSIFMTIGVITITKAGVVDITNRRKIKALIFQGFSF